MPFSPNADGVNDEIQIVSTYPPKSFTWEIFDRWGKPISRIEDIQQAWDGKLANGMQAPEGVYSFLLPFSHGRRPGSSRKGDDYLDTVSFSFYYRPCRLAENGLSLLIKPSFQVCRFCGTVVSESCSPYEMFMQG